MLPGAGASAAGQSVASEVMEDISFVQEALKRIHSHKGVRGSIIVNSEGIPLRTTLEHEEALQYASLAMRLSSRARAAVKTLSINAKDTPEAQDELLTLRVRSKKHEIIITPAYEKGREFSLIVIQDPSALQPAF